MVIHHVGFLTKNLKKSESEFLDLGFEIEKEAKFDHIRKVNISFLINNGYRVELIEPVGKDSPLYPLLKHYKNTPYHFCYESENIDSDRRVLSEKGFFIMQEPEIAPCLDNLHVCFLMGRNSGIIELVDKQTNIND